MGLGPYDVFTPAVPPLDKGNVYARRDAELQIKKAFNVHRTPIIYGDFGVGKTSTIKKFAQQEAADCKTFYFDVGSQDDFADFIKGFLEDEQYVVTKTVREVSVEGSGSLFSMLSAKAQGKFQHQHELLVSSPTEDRVLDLMNQRQRIVIIDELHRASPEFKSCLAEFVKSLVNRGLANVRLALVGTVRQPFEMVRLDEGIRRIVQEVHVPPMSEKESAYIVEEGMRRCELQIDHELVGRIVSLSGGLPSVIHELCLSCALHASLDPDRIVTSSYLNMATDDLLKSRYGQYHEEWQRVVERTGVIRWRQQILYALASIPEAVVSTEQLSSKLGEILGRTVKSSDYTTPMRSLQNRYRVISRVTTTGDQDEFALWTFRDPSFKAFINFLLRRSSHVPRMRIMERLRQVEEP